MRPGGRRETALEQRATAWARSREVPVSKLTSPTGIFDRVFWLPGGRPLLIEFKRSAKARVDPGREKLQKYYAAWFAKMGYAAEYGVATWERFMELMEANTNGAYGRSMVRGTRVRRQGMPAAGAQGRGE